MRLFSTTAPLLMIVLCDGPWDQTLVFDPKMGSATVEQESGASTKTYDVASSIDEDAGAIRKMEITIHTSRPSVTSFFDTYADRSVILNGLVSTPFGEGASLQASIGLAAEKNGERIDLGSHFTQAVSGRLGVNLDWPHILFDTPALTGTPQTTLTLASADLLKFSPNSSANDLPATTAAKVRANFVSQWASMASSVASASLDADKITAVRQSEKTTAKFSTALQAAITSTMSSLNGVPALPAKSLRRNALLGLDLMAQDVTGSITVTSDGWARAKTASERGAMFESLFSDLNSAMAYANTKGLLSRLHVIVLARGGLSPIARSDGSKLHWPYTSALIVSPLVRGGVTIGKSDEVLRGEPIQPIFGRLTGDKLEELSLSQPLAALYLKMGLPSATIFPNVTPLSVMLKR